MYIPIFLPCIYTYIDRYERDLEEWSLYILYIFLTFLCFHFSMMSFEVQVFSILKNFNSFVFNGFTFLNLIEEIFTYL